MEEGGLGRGVEGDYTAIPTALLKFSPAITGQNWSLILFCGFGKEILATISFICFKNAFQEF